MLLLLVVFIRNGRQQSEVHGTGPAAEPANVRRSSDERTPPLLRGRWGFANDEGKHLSRARLERVVSKPATLLLAHESNSVARVLIRSGQVLCCAKETQPKEVALAMNELAFEHYWGALRKVPDAITVDDDIISSM